MTGSLPWKPSSTWLPQSDQLKIRLLHLEQEVEEVQGVQEDLHLPLLELVVLQVGQGGLVVQEVLKVLLVQEELLAHLTKVIIGLLLWKYML